MRLRKLAAGMHQLVQTTVAGGLRSPHPVVLAGLACGVLDITVAFVVYGHYGLTPLRLLQGIAAGLIGPGAARSGGLATALLGLGCHFTVAFSAAGAYYAATRRLRQLLRHPVIAGALYGPAVYFFMQYVVLPLTAASRPPFSLKLTLIGLAIHVSCVGLPIALLVRRPSA